MIWPTAIADPTETIIPWSPDAAGGLAGLTLTALNNAASAVYPAANLILYVPFWLTQPIVARVMFTHNGTVVAGNVDIGLYDSAFTKLVGMGSTAQSGTSALQTFNITDTPLGPGLFYLAVTLSDASTATLVRGTLGNAIFGQLVGCAEETPGSFGLPAVGTPIAWDRTYVPVFGLALGATV